jgi:hypothetical protein
MVQRTTDQLGVFAMQLFCIFWGEVDVYALDLVRNTQMTTQTVTTAFHTNEGNASPILHRQCKPLPTLIKETNHCGTEYCEKTPPERGEKHVAILNFKSNTAHLLL